MNIQDLLIILTAISIGILYLWKLRSYDVYEKEPVIKLILITILGGIVSVAVSLILYEYVDAKRNFFDAIFKIGLIEEFSKLAAIFFLYLIIKKDFNEIVDGIIYMAAIALGFAIIENILYAFRSELPYQTLFLRSVYAILGHISFSGYLGIAFFIHKKVHSNYTGIIISILIAALAHGFYDGFIFHKEISFLFNTIFLIIVFLQFWMYRLTLGFSRFRGKLMDYDFIMEPEKILSYCSKCEIEIESHEYKLINIECCKCNKCGNYLFDEANTVNLFNYFRPIANYKRYLKKASSEDSITFLDSNQKIFFNPKSRYISAEYGDLSDWLDTKNTEDRRKVMKIPVFGLALWAIGLRYLKTS